MIAIRNGMTFEGLQRRASACPVAIWLTEGGVEDAAVTGPNIFGKIGDIYYKISAVGAVEEFITWWDRLSADDPCVIEPDPEPEQDEPPLE